MTQKSHASEFKEQALRKLRQRGDHTQRSVADELNIALPTLKSWLQDSKKTTRALPVVLPLPADAPANAWTP